MLILTIVNKLVLVGMLFLLTSFHIYDCRQPDDLWIEQQMIEQSVTTPAATNNIDRKIFCIIKYCNQYSAPIKHITRLIRIESSFKRTAYNKSSSARGLGQHLSYYWKPLLYKVDDGNLGRHIKKNYISNTAKYWFRISYSVEATVMAYNACVKIKKGEFIKNVRWIFHKKRLSN